MNMQRRYLFLSILFLFGIHFPADALVYKNATLTVQDKSVLGALYSVTRNALEKSLAVDNSQKEIIFQEEVKPNIYDIIPSHKVLRRIKNSKGETLLDVLVEVDMSSLHSLFAFNSTYLKDDSLRAVIAIRGYEGGKPGNKKGHTKGENNLNDWIASSMSNYLDRRLFQLILYSNELSAQSYIEEDFDLKATFKNIAERTDANLVIFLEPKFEYITKKPRNRKSMHFHMKTSFYERSSDLILLTLTKSTPMWLGKNAPTTKNKKIIEKLKGFINYFTYSTFKMAGIKYLAHMNKSESLILRVVNPPDYQSLQEFKKYLLKVLPSLESIMERELGKGRVDYQVKLGKTKEQSLMSAIKSMSLENYSVFIDNLTQDKVLPIHFEKKQKEQPEEKLQNKAGTVIK